MADTVTSQTLQDDSSHVVMCFTDISDGVGESLVTKVDVSTLAVSATGLPCTDVIIEEIWFSCCGMGVQILWDATTPVTAILIGGNAAGSAATSYFDFRSFAGIKNNSGAGKTGDIKFSTVNPSAQDTYFVILKMKKVF